MDDADHFALKLSSSDAFEAFEAFEELDGWDGALFVVDGLEVASEFRSGLGAGALAPGWAAAEAGVEVERRESSPVGRAAVVVAACGCGAMGIGCSPEVR